MIRGTPPYTAFGLTECKIVPEIKLSGSDRWLDEDEVSQRGDRVWGELQWDLSGLDRLERLRVSFQLKLDTSLYREAYSEAKILHDIGFGVRLWNKASRRRELRSGNLSHRPQKGKTKGLLTATCVFEIPLAEFAGEIDLQPIIYVKADSIFDRRTSQAVNFGSVLGWAMPTVVVLERSRKGLSTMFEFRWVKFSEKRELGLDDKDLYHLVWEPRPLIYLNQDVEFFETVLMSEAKIGKAARLRNTLEVLIAHQILMSCLSVVISELLRLHREDPSSSADDLIGGLKPHDQSIFREWYRDLDPVGGADREIQEIVEAILAQGEQQAVLNFTDSFPGLLQDSLTTKDVTAFLLKEMMDDSEAVDV
jgi:hypothetical protein